jgi:hypothetical protein
MPRCFSTSIQSEVAWRASFARLHRAGQLDGAAEQQQLLGQRGLARVGVGDDREGAALICHVAQQVALLAEHRDIAAPSGVCSMSAHPTQGSGREVSTCFGLPGSCGSAASADFRPFRRAGAPTARLRGGRVDHIRMQVSSA